MLLILPLLLGLGLAQRPTNASICDYYAQAKYGANNSDTQFQLVQGIVALAFGGSFNISNISSDITGILNPGKFNNVPVDLRGFFNGSLASTNLNNQPVGLNWLDGGGLDPIQVYLNGSTPNLVLSNTTNEYRLFNGFMIAFSRMFGCTVPPPLPPSTSAPLSLAYVHKFMDLNYTELGHFINQLTLATTHYGFSSIDSAAMNTRLNSLYNVRCAPAITLNPAQGPQLLSLCQDPTCPLAQPNSDCASYVNLTANGVASGSTPSGTSSGGTLVSPSPSSTSSSPTSSSPAASSSSAAATSAAASSGGTTLSGGAIAGIAVGGAAALGLVGAFLFVCLRRRNKKSQPQQVPPAYPHTEPGSAYSPYASMPQSPFNSPPMSEATRHYSYVSSEPTMAEMESPRHTASPPPKAQVGPIYEMGVPDHNNSVWGQVGSRDIK